MIQTSKSDIVSPAVAAVHPEALLRQIVFALQDFFGEFDEFLFHGIGLLDIASDDFFHFFDQKVCGVPVGFQIIIGVQPFESDGVVSGHLQILVHQILLSLTLLSDGQVHTQRQLRVVLEQGVGPGDAVTPLVQAVRDTRHAGAPRLGASCAVGPVYSVAKELGEQLGVRCLAAACAGGRELAQRLPELAASDGVRCEQIALVRKVQSVVPVLQILLCRVRRHHADGRVLGRTYRYAAAAARTVMR